MNEQSISSDAVLLDYSVCIPMVEDIIDMASKHLSEPHEDVARVIWQTYEFARDAHGNQRRKSGEPYITHPLEATKLLMSLKPDLVSIQACILHDVIEDTPKTEDDIRELF